MIAFLYAHPTLMAETRMNLADQFDGNLFDPPDFDEEYQIFEGSKAKRLTLLHKLILLHERLEEFEDKFDELLEEPNVFDQYIVKTNDQNNRIYPLTLACRHCVSGNSVRIIEKMINKGADISVVDDWTPFGALTLNSTSETKKMIKHFLNLNIDVNIKSVDGWTPVNLASRYSGHRSSFEIVKILLDADADIDIKTNDGWTPLHSASRYSGSESSFATVTALINAKADINAKTDDGWTPLHMASRYSNGESSFATVTALIDAKADINAKLNTGWTPLHMASRYSNSDSSLKTVTALIGAKADINSKLNDGWTPLHLASRHSNSSSSLGTVVALVDAKADINSKKADGWTSLHLASRNSNSGSSLGTVVALVDAKADVNAKKDNGATPLHLVSTYSNEHSSLGTVAVLLTAGADVNARTNTDDTPLYCAATSAESSLETVELLLSSGANPNAMKDGIPLLTSVVCLPENRLNIDVVSRLLEANVKVNLIDKQGYVALQRAINRDRWESKRDLLVKLLLNNYTNLTTEDYIDLEIPDDTIRRMVLETKDRCTLMNESKRIIKTKLKKYIPKRAHQIINRYGGKRFGLLAVKFRMKSGFGLPCSIDSIDKKMIDHYAINTDEQLVSRIKELDD